MLHRTLLATLFLLTVTLSNPGKATANDNEEPRSGLFILDQYRNMISTEEGEVKVVFGYRWNGDPSPMHISFVNMVPKTLFIPQYIDANLILFVRSGKAKLGWILKDKLAERKLRAGDIIIIPGGSTFYIFNHCKDELLQIIASIDSAETLGYSTYFDSFFIGGGRHTASIFSGFDAQTMTTAFNVTVDELENMMGQAGGPIVRLSHQHSSDDDMMEENENDDEGLSPSSKWRRMFDGVLGRRQSKHDEVGAHKAYNIFDKKPDFSNDYGSCIAVDEKEYSPLKHTGVGVFLVNLTEGSLMAPHVNPSATEYGIVLNGIGTIQVVFPNGTTAMNAEVSSGDVFWVPRYFPFSQAASRGGPLMFFGFTTSSRKNHPQFLAGRKSVLRKMRGKALAMAFNVSESEIKRVLNAQHEQVILPITREEIRRQKLIKGGTVDARNFVVG